MTNHTATLFAPVPAWAVTLACSLNQSAHEVRSNAPTGGRHRWPFGPAERGKVIKLLLRLDGAECFLCQHPILRGNGAPSIEHLVAWSDGGLDDLENFAITHIACNLRRGNRSLTEAEWRRAGLLLARRHVRLSGLGL